MHHLSTTPPSPSALQAGQRRFGRWGGLLLGLIVLLFTTTATARTPSVRGTLPVQNGELVGNTVMFVGYDLAESGTTPKVELVDDTSKAAVPIRVTARCKKGRTAKSSRRCNVLVRMMKWTVGHHYRAVLHGFTLNFTIVEGDPGMPRKSKVKSAK